MDLRGLSRALNRTIEDITKATNKLSIEVAMEVEKYLVNTTPVDTSQALSNWIASLDNPESRFIEPHVPGMQGSTKVASATRAISDAKQIIKSKRVGQSIHLTNSAPYIKPLNDEDYSRQTAAGFVEHAVNIIGRDVIQRFRL